jgi:RimJ/RimL family protein N-acetyltransferase
MPAVTLLNLDPPVIEQILQHPEDFQREREAQIGDVTNVLRDVALQIQGLLEAKKCDPMWLGYLGVDQESRLIVGSCAFKGEPVNGVVEIAYYTFPPFEHRGYATSMAQELLRIARESGLVRSVIAHTLPERNASTRVLEKNGLQFVREVVDPEDGLVWKWERKLADVRPVPTAPSPPPSD